MAELAEKAKLISLEAGSKVAAAMKDVISAAAGIAGFAMDSARDLTTYMVRRGQMTQDEAEKLLRAADTAHSKRSVSERNKPTASMIAAEKTALIKAQAARAAEIAAAAFAKLHPPRPPKPPSKVFMPKPVKGTKAAAQKRVGKTVGADRASTKASTARKAAPKGPTSRKKSTSLKRVVTKNPAPKKMPTKRSASKKTAKKR